MIRKILDEIKERIKPEIYFTMDVEGNKTLKTGVPTTYFVYFPIDLPKFCFKSFGLHVHILKDDADKLSDEQIYQFLKKRKKRLEKKATKSCKYFRLGWCLKNSKIENAAEKLGMKVLGTNVRYYTAWLPRKKIIFITHSYNSPLFINLLIFYLKFFHPFAEWKTFNGGV